MAATTLNSTVLSLLAPYSSALSGQPSADPAYGGLEALVRSLVMGKGNFGGGGGGGGYGGGTGGSDLFAGMAPHQEALRIANWIENKPGFEVSGLHGWEGQGPISSGHIEGSQHYGPGYAGDVSYAGGGRFPDETAALNWLVARATQRFGSDLTENIWQEPGHYDHWHYGTRPGG